MNFYCFNQFTFSAVLTALLLAPASPAWAAKKIEESKQNLNEVKERIELLKKELDQSQEAHKDAADALKESEVAIDVYKRQIQFRPPSASRTFSQSPKFTTISTGYC